MTGSVTSPTRGTPAAAEEMTLAVNGVVHTVTCEPDMPLLWVLRDISRYFCAKPEYG